MDKRLEAIRRMVSLGLDKEVIDRFIKSGKIYVSDRYNDIFKAVLNPSDSYTDLNKEIKLYEKKYGALVYHVQLTRLEFGECYTFFYVSDEMDEWDEDRMWLEKGFPFCYVWNKTIPEFSEHGSVGIEPCMGGLLRVA